MLQSKTSKQKVKLHISHQMKSYSKCRGHRRSIYTCFCPFAALGHIKEILLKYPKSWAAICRKSSQVLNSTFYFKCVNITLLLIAVLLLIRSINKQYFTKRQGLRIFSIICRSNPGAYNSYLLS